jgi:rubrerythrin
VHTLLDLLTNIAIAAPIAIGILVVLAMIERAIEVPKERRWEAGVRPGVERLAETEACAWCGAKPLSWDGEFRPLFGEIWGSHGPYPHRMINLHCPACGKKTRHFIYPDGSSERGSGPDLDRVPRRCNHCGQLFRGTNKDRCPQCDALDNRVVSATEAFSQSPAGHD